MERKTCSYIDFCVEIFYDPDDCEPVGTPCADGCCTCRPANIKMQTRDAVTRITLVQSHFVHLMPVELEVQAGSIRVCIERILMCEAGCRENNFGIPVKWCGSGMLLPPGEYTFCFPIQVAWGFPLGVDICEESHGGTVTLLLEPATSAEIQAAGYNSSFRSC